MITYFAQIVRFGFHLSETHLESIKVNVYNLMWDVMITRILIQQLDVYVTARASLLARVWRISSLHHLCLVDFRRAAVVRLFVSFQRCTTFDLIHQRFVTYPWIGQRFTVDQASHSEGLPRHSLLGQSRVQIL